MHLSYWVLRWAADYSWKARVAFRCRMLWTPWLESAFTVTAFPSPSYPRISLLTSHRGGSTELLPRNVNSQSCSLLHFSWNSQGQTTDHDGAGNQQGTQKGNKAWEPLSSTCLTTSSPPSPSHPNTNPRLRFSALCPPPSPIHALLPLNRAVFPSPHVPPPQLLAACFSTWEPNPRVQCPPLIHVQRTPPYGFVPPCSAPLSSIRSTAKRGRDPAARTVLVCTTVNCV